MLQLFPLNRNADLVRDGQVLAVFSDVLSDEDVVVAEQDVQQLVDAVQTLFPHFRLRTEKTERRMSSHASILKQKWTSRLNKVRMKSAHLHEGGQIGVVVIKRGDDVELDLNRDALTQVVLFGDASKSMEELDLSSSDTHTHTPQFNTRNTTEQETIRG